MTADRPSINRAFRELGLHFQWDEGDWAVLCAMPDLKSQLEYWLARNHPHLLRVYDADFLAGIVAHRLAHPGGDSCALEAHAPN